MGFTKLFQELVTSTIWQEPNDCRVLWITILALKDQNHVCHATVPALAKICDITPEECERYLEQFQQPDKYSRSQEHEGRRIQRVEGGYLVLNAELYQWKGNTEGRRDYIRQKVREHRERKREGKQAVNAVNNSANNSKQSKHNKNKNQNKNQKETKNQTASDFNGSSESHGVGLLAAQGAAIAPKPAPGKTPDPVFELFADRYRTAYEGVPYQSRTGDFVQLAKLRKSLGEDFPIDSWAVAVGNYLATPQRAHTLADLAVNYATFRRAPLDEFARPVDTQLGKTSRHNMALLQQIRNEERET